MNAVHPHMAVGASPPNHDPARWVGLRTKTYTHKTETGMNDTILSYSISFRAQKGLRGRSARLIEISCSTSLRSQTSLKQALKMALGLFKATTSHKPPLNENTAHNTVLHYSKEELLRLSSWHPQLKLIIHLHSYCVSLV